MLLITLLLNLIAMSDACLWEFQRIGSEMVSIYSLAATQGRSPSLDEQLDVLKASRGLSSEQKTKLLSEVWQSNPNASLSDRQKLLEFSNQWMLKDFASEVGSSKPTRFRPEFSTPSILEFGEDLQKSDLRRRELVLVVSPYCPHCVDVKPVFESLRDLEVEGERVGLKILTVGEMSEAERQSFRAGLLARGWKAGVNSVPALLTRNGDAVTIDENFPRDKSGLEQLVRDFAKWPSAPE